MMVERRYLDNILSANKLFSLIYMKRTSINSDNHKFASTLIKQLPFILTKHKKGAAPSDVSQHMF
jgi:hypothetical protein